MEKKSNRNWTLDRFAQWFNAVVPGAHRKIDAKDIKIAMTIGNPELAVQLVQSGIGIAFVSKWSVFKAIKDGSIKILDISGRKLKRKFYLVNAEKEPVTMTGKIFWDFVKGYRFFVPL